MNNKKLQQSLDFLNKSIESYKKDLSVYNDSLDSLDLTTLTEKEMQQFYEFKKIITHLQNPQNVTTQDFQNYDTFLKNMMKK
jgi:hypothetical protein